MINNAFLCRTPALHCSRHYNHTLRLNGMTKYDLSTSKYDLGTSKHDLGTSKYDLGTSKFDLHCRLPGAGSGLCSGPVFRASELSSGPGARNTGPEHRPGTQARNTGPDPRPGEARIHLTLMLSGPRTVTGQSRKKEI